MSAHRGSLSGPMTADRLETKMIYDGLTTKARQADRAGAFKTAAQLRFVAALVQDNPAEITRGRQWLEAADKVIR